jgi:predicted porin
MKIAVKQILSTIRCVVFLQQLRGLCVFRKKSLRCSDYPTNILIAQFFFQQSLKREFSMNKKLIAVAVAAAFAAPMAASANATIYGAIHTSIQMNDSEINDFPVDVEDDTLKDNFEVRANDGQLGIQGSEDLGGGLKAIYKIETNFDGDSGGTTFTTDEVWVGLSGGFGTAIIGREDHPYKNALNATGYNPFGDKILDMDANSGFLGGVGFRQATANNAVAYVSPNISGFSFTGAIVAPEGSGRDDDPVNDGFDAYSLGANWSGGGFKVGAGYEDIDVSDDSEVEAWFIAGSYTFGGFTVGLAYEEQDDAPVTVFSDATDGQDDFSNTPWTADDVETIGVSLTYAFGNNRIGANYVHEEQSDATITGGDLDGADAGDIDFDSWGIEFAHSLSNRTEVYAAYAYAEHDGDVTDAEDDRFAIGIIHSF